MADTSNIGGSVDVGIYQVNTHLVHTDRSNGEPSPTGGTSPTGLDSEGSTSTTIERHQGSPDGIGTQDVLWENRAAETTEINGTVAKLRASISKRGSCTSL